ncbi:MAG: hypothetical protein J6U27_06355 [Spirochaetales bacterium]|nr:hypothetical protein [Spirochaetales bacterium]
MKKFLVLIMVILMVFAMVACKQDVKEPADPTNSEEAGKTALAEQGSSGSKGIDNKGFKIVGSFKTADSSVKVEVGGKDDLYWIGTYDNAADSTADYVYFRMKDANTVSIYTGETWVDFEASTSIKDALFGEGGVYSALVDNIVYLSFQLKSMYGTMFSDLKYEGSTTKNGVTCSKYTATFSLEEIGEIANVSVYVEPTFAVTVGFDFALADSFVKKYGELVGKEMLNTAFSYTADVDFDVSTGEVPNYATITATIGK